MARIPTAAEEARFWSMVESAWERVGDEPSALRKALVGRDGDDELDAVGRHLDTFLDHLLALTEGLSSEELTSLDRVVERKLYDLDRADVHEVTDGSDDGFLYARGFIVAMGKDFYDAVLADPSVAADSGFERLCYAFAHLHEKRFGDWPQLDSGISRETASNSAGWS